MASPLFLLDKKDGIGNTALMHAAMAVTPILARHWSTPERSSKCKPVHDGSTALYCAASLNQPAVVHLLVASGADHTIKRKDGQTAMEVAVEEGNTECAALLL